MQICVFIYKSVYLQKMKCKIYSESDKGYNTVQGRLDWDLGEVEESRWWGEERRGWARQCRRKQTQRLIWGKGTKTQLKKKQNQTVSRASQSQRTTRTNTRAIHWTNWEERPRALPHGLNNELAGSGKWSRAKQLMRVNGNQQMTCRCAGESRSPAKLWKWLTGRTRQHKHGTRRGGQKKGRIPTADPCSFDPYSAATT